MQFDIEKILLMRLDWGIGGLLQIENGLIEPTFVE
jgi:hypothetical protein